MNPSPAAYAPPLRSLPLMARGKVRDNYAAGSDRILMVASDRLSAFDIVLPQPVPGKGRVLTEMALFWFDRLGHVVPNHLTGEAPESVVAPDEREAVRGRAMLVRRLQPILVEAVVRGYLTGSGLKEYEASGTVCGLALPPGLKNASRLPEPLFTPAAKAAVGEHDENIPFEEVVRRIGAPLAERIRAVSLQLYSEAAAYALARGIIIADTKFEFGLDENGTLTLMDEILTPDSSRFWPADQVVEGQTPPSFDKQPLRDWLQREYPGFGSAGLPPGLVVPQDVIDACLARYQKAQALLTA
jgi:phosphoribosylaminoimidazole-succinocarboxamide synthase